MVEGGFLRNIRTIFTDRRDQLDLVMAVLRTFGFLELYDRVPLIPALVGLFAVSEAFAVIEGQSVLTAKGREAMRASGWGETFEGVRIALSKWWHIIWTSLIGLVIGVVPGAGAAIASFVAYQQSKTFSSGGCRSRGF